MKIHLVLILAIIIMFSSVQESLSQFSSIMFSTGNCCSTTLVVDEEYDCEVDESEKSESCCEGSSCDCTCCVHISLFNTSFGELSFQGEAEKEIYNYVDTHGFSIPFPIFHPPHLLG